MNTGASDAQGPVPVSVELGKFAVNVHRVRAVEVDVLVVGGPDVGQHGGLCDRRVGGESGEFVSGIEDRVGNVGAEASAVAITLI